MGIVNRRDTRSASLSGAEDWTEWNHNGSHRAATVSQEGDFSMKRVMKRAVLSALTTLGVTASLSIATAPQALAIDVVGCGRSDFLTVDWHVDYGSGWTAEQTCFANAGEFDMDRYGTEWLDRISTGNNRVQWWGDGRWQPDTPIGKNTVYTFPNHPGGVALDWIRIL